MSSVASKQKGIALSRSGDLSRLINKLRVRKSRAGGILFCAVKFYIKFCELLIRQVHSYRDVKEELRKKYFWTTVGSTKKSA